MQNWGKTTQKKSGMSNFQVINGKKLQSNKKFSISIIPPQKKAFFPPSLFFSQIHIPQIPSKTYLIYSGV
jgi:hypothetical protein